MARKAITPIDRVVARNVRIHRMAKRVTQKQLAKHLGVTFQQVQKYEKAANRIGSGRLIQIAELLGVPITTLFVGAEIDESLKDSSILDHLTDRQSVQLVQAFSKISDPKLRQSIVLLVSHIARHADS